MSALHYIKITVKNNIFFCDSKSALQALLSKWDHHTVQIIMKFLVFLHTVRKTVIFCWLPGHMGISGNERADETTESSVTLTDYSVPSNANPMLSVSSCSLTQPREATPSSSYLPTREAMPSSSYLPTKTITPQLSTESCDPGMSLNCAPTRVCRKSTSRPGYVVKVRPDPGYVVKQCPRIVMNKIFDWH